MVLRLFFVGVALTAVSGSICASRKDKQFPPQILAAKTITVVAHYGSRPSAFDPVKGRKFKSDAEAVLRDSGRFTLVEEPAKSDLVLLLAGGYSPGLFGFRDRITTGAIFLGGAHQAWTSVPLWIAVKTPTLRTSSAASALTKMFLKGVKKAEQSATGLPAGTGEETGVDDIKSQDSRKENAETSSEGVEALSLPGEILQAKKVMVILRIDAVAGPQGEQKEKSVEKEIKKWGRFSLVDNPTAADLLLVCVKFMESTDPRSYDLHTYENLLIFKGGSKNPDWNTMPLWTAMRIEAPLGPSPGTQMVRWLRKQIESPGTLTIQPVPTHPPN